MMTGNGDKKVHATPTTIRVPPPGLPKVSECRSPLEKVGGNGVPAFLLNLSTAYMV